MPNKILYSTMARAEGGRDGHGATLDGTLDLRLSTPKELGGAGGAGNNPEKLFAVGYAACFIGAMKVAASETRTRLPEDANVTAIVGIGPRTEGGFGLAIDLQVVLPGIDHNAAEVLVARAHAICPYSNAVRGNVDVGLSVVQSPADLSQGALS